MALKWMSNVQRIINHFQEVIVTVDGQRIIDLEKPFVPGLNTVIVTVNGAEKAPNRTYIEKTTTSLEFPVNYLRKNDEVRVYYIPNTLSLGDITVVGVRTDLNYLNDKDYNSIALSVADKKFYIYKGTEGWKEFILPFTTQNVGVLFTYEKQAITDPTSRIITLQSLTYSTGAGAILVFVDDQLVDPSLYEEVSNTSIAFNIDLPVNPDRLTHEIEVVAGSTDAWEDTHNHSVAYSYNLDGSIQSETITSGGSLVKTTTYGYDGQGNIVQETVDKGNKVIVKMYQYDVNGNIINIEITVS
jgi:hypothetical protein